MLNFYNLFITLPGLNEQLSLVKKLQRAKVETWQGGHSAVLGGGTTLTSAGNVTSKSWSQSTAQKDAAKDYQVSTLVTGLAFYTYPRVLAFLCLFCVCRTTWYSLKVILKP